MSSSVSYFSSRASSRLAIACALLLGCEPSSEPYELSAAIGPEGGTLAGEAGTIFEGVEVDVPPGALSQTTQISITEVQDDTPLPEGAERIGVQFAIESDADLAAPISVRLPVSDFAAQSFAATGEDIFVWAREGEGWTRVEPTTASPSSVTFELSRFTTAAAGVFLRPVVDLCETITCEAPEPSCTLVGSFCFEDIPGPVVAFGNRHLQNGALYYTTTRPRVRAPDLRSAVRVKLEPGFPFSRVDDVELRSPAGLAVDGGGNLWDGQKRIRFDATAGAADFFPGGQRIGVNGRGNVGFITALVDGTQVSVRVRRPDGSVLSDTVANVPASQVIAVFADPFFADHFVVFALDFNSASPNATATIFSVSETGIVRAQLHESRSFGRIDDIDPLGVFVPLVRRGIGNTVLAQGPPSNGAPSPGPLLSYEITASGIQPAIELSVPGVTGSGNVITSLAPGPDGNLYLVVGSFGVRGLQRFNPAAGTLTGITMPADRTASNILGDGTNLVVETRSASSSGLPPRFHRIHFVN